MEITVGKAKPPEEAPPEEEQPPPPYEAPQPAPGYFLARDDTGTLTVEVPSEWGSAYRRGL